MKDWGTTDYEDAQAPEGWTLHRVSDPPEPNGWFGTLRVAVGYRDDEWATWFVRPEGYCVHGDYMLDKQTALHDYYVLYRKELERAVCDTP